MVIHQNMMNRAHVWGWHEKPREAANNSSTATTRHQFHRQPDLAQSCWHMDNLQEINRRLQPLQKP